VLFLGRLGLAAQRLKATTGAEGLVGERGSTLTAIGVETPGQVRVHGEIWRATSPVPLAQGCGIRVTKVDGLTLVVEPLGDVEPTASGGGAP
jgi:membrane-bound serine protease (ClpP class)